jgi:hypothetical protein
MYKKCPFYGKVRWENKCLAALGDSRQRLEDNQRPVCKCPKISFLRPAGQRLNCYERPVLNVQSLWENRWTIFKVLDISWEMPKITRRPTGRSARHLYVVCKYLRCDMSTNPKIFSSRSCYFFTQK